MRRFFAPHSMQVNEWWHFQQVEQRMMQHLVAFCTVMRPQTISLLHSSVVFFYFGCGALVRSENPLVNTNEKKTNTILIYHALFGSAQNAQHTFHCKCNRLQRINGTSKKKPSNELVYVWVCFCFQRFFVCALLFTEEIIDHKNRIVDCLLGAVCRFFLSLRSTCPWFVRSGFRAKRS